MPDICSASDTNLKDYGIIAFHIRMDESLSRVNFGVGSELVVPILLGIAHTYRFIESIYLAERKIIPCESTRVPICIVHEAGSAAKNDNSYFHGEVGKDLAGSVTLSR